jgi:hypothetical protein
MAKKRSSLSKKSKTDWQRLYTRDDQNIELSADHPEGDVEHLHRPKVRQGLQPRPAKAPISDNQEGSSH